MTGTMNNTPDLIAEEATQYCKRLFTVKLDPVQDKQLEDLCNQQFDLWEHNVVVSAQAVQEAINEAPERQTCGADKLVEELRQTAAATDS